MRILRRILVTIAATGAVILVGVYWVAPVALAFYSARKAPPVARIVPIELTDHSISAAAGAKLSYVGYEFEVPWTDLDDSKTALYPKDKPDKTKVVLTFRSGLKIMVSAIPPRTFAEGFETGSIGTKMPPPSFEAVFGRGAATSDYAFVKTVYEFTPDKMHYWTGSVAVHAREEALLIIKSIMPSEPAETGIFNVRNESYRGFQQGDPRIRQNALLLELYSDSNGGVEFLFAQDKYNSREGVTQPEINRIVQSLKKNGAASDPIASR